MQKAVIFETCCTDRKFLAEQWIKNAWSERPVFFKKKANCCEIRKVDDGSGDDDDGDGSGDYDDDDDNNNNNKAT